MYKEFWLSIIDGSPVKFTGKQLNCNCPVCGEQKKHFYINIENGLWDCKKCIQSGNAWGFLKEYKGMDTNDIIEYFKRYHVGIEYRNKENKITKKIENKDEPFKALDINIINKYNNITEKQLKELANERGLSIEILKKYKIGVNEAGEYTVPFYDEKGNLRNIQTKGKDKTISIKDGQGVLFGIDDLEDEHTDIFIVEGAWSAMALKQRGYRAVGTCGAGNIRNDQLPLFKCRDVFIIPDNDDAGQTGANKIKDKLNNIARHIYIIIPPVEDKKDIRDFFKNGGTQEHFDYLIKQAILERLSQLPINLDSFLKKEIPPVRYYIRDILQEGGKAMISASPNVGKSIFIQNMALDISIGNDNKFLGKFEVSQAKVLYLDLEMGEPALKERFAQMVKSKNKQFENIYVKYIPSLDLLTDESKKLIEGWIEELKIKVLIFDPLGSAWSGNENDQEQVGRLTSYFNTLSEIYGVAILVVHHWRKATKEFKSGGQMAAGSYKWSAWLDNHITLAENMTGTTVSCEKNRNREKFQPFLIKINNDLSLGFVTDFKKKYDEDNLIELFDYFDKKEISVPELIKKSKEIGGPSETKIRELIDISKEFILDTSGKAHIIKRREKQEEIKEWDEK